MCISVEVTRSGLMMVIVCINLTGLRDAHITGKYYFWVCQWRCFWNRLAFHSVEVKRSSLTNVGGYHLTHFGPKWNKEVKKGWNLSFLSWDIYVLLLSHMDIGIPGFRFSLRLKVTPVAPLVLRPLDSDWIILLAFPVLYLANSKLWVLLPEERESKYWGSLAICVTANKISEC